MEPRRHEPLILPCYRCEGFTRPRGTSRANTTAQVRAAVERLAAGRREATPAQFQANLWQGACTVSTARRPAPLSRQPSATNDGTSGPLLSSDEFRVDRRVNGRLHPLWPERSGSASIRGRSSPTTLAHSEAAASRWRRRHPASVAHGRRRRRASSRAHAGSGGARRSRPHRGPAGPKSYSVGWWAAVSRRAASARRHRATGQACRHGGPRLGRRPARRRPLRRPDAHVGQALARHLSLWTRHQLAQQRPAAGGQLQRRHVVPLTLVELQVQQAVPRP